VLDVPDAQRLRQLSDWLTVEKQLRLPPPTTQLSAPATRLAAAAAVPSCRAFLCTAGPPMRGGYRLDVTRDAGVRGPCTNGFNLRNQANGVLYTLTAGHCVRGARHAKVDYSFHHNVSVGYEQSASGLVNHVFPTDYAAMPYTSSPGAARWLPRNRNEVSSICVPGESTAACRNGAIALTGVMRYEDMRSGQVVCHTGSTEAGYGGAGWSPGTRCGVINGWDASGIRTNTCGRPGDSGSPLFSEVNRKAYGILHGGTVTQGKCRTGREVSTFSPISKILTRLPSTIRLVVAP